MREETNAKAASSETKNLKRIKRMSLLQMGMKMEIMTTSDGVKFG